MGKVSRNRSNDKDTTASAAAAVAGVRGSESRKCGKRLPAVLRGLWKYLKSDCFMYGPLLDRSWDGEPACEQVLRRKGNEQCVSAYAFINRHQLSSAEIRKKSKMKVTRSSLPRLLKKCSDDANKKLQEASQPAFACLNAHQQPQQQQKQQQQPGVATPEARERTAKDAAAGTGAATAARGSPSREEGSETDMAEDNEHSASDGYEVLDDDDADTILSSLVARFGGSYSKDLGIDVEKGDGEVEKWFLAVVLFNKSSSPELSKQAFKNVLAFGVHKVVDTLTMDQEQLSEVLRKAGYPSYTERTAARLQRLATQIKNDHSGSICSLKEVTDPSELNRQLSSLFGLSHGSTRMFIRELRGVWPAVSSEPTSRAKNAARHLQLGDWSYWDSRSRDVEAALTKLGQIHARHYRDCAGGLQCGMLTEAS